MRPIMMCPGAPAGGHLSGGYWHPGAIETCSKGRCEDYNKQDVKQHDQRAA